MQVLPILPYTLQYFLQDERDKDDWMVVFNITRQQVDLRGAFAAQEIYPHRGIEYELAAHMLRIWLSEPSHFTRPFNPSNSFFFIQAT